MKLSLKNCNELKISVIVPVYNTEQYLEKCLNSILDQTLKEIEVIVINDGSTDNSQTIIEDFKNRDIRINAVIKENGGLSDARNMGIDLAKGEFIAFIDSDDFIEIEMLEKMYNLAKIHNSEIVLCDLVKIDENGKEFKQLPQSPQLQSKIILADDLTIFGEMSCFACNKIFKKSLFERHRFKKGIHFEDIELIPKLVLDSKIISKINESFYKYFDRKDSITKTHTKKGLDMFIAIDKVSDYFEKSVYSQNKKELKRFQIIQGFYSYLAYVAYVRDVDLKKKMLNRLTDFLHENKIEKKEIINYKRFRKNYINSLSVKKRIFYTIALLNINFLNKF